MTSSPGVMFPFISARFFKQDKETPSLQSQVRSPQDNRLVAPPPPTRPSLQVLDLQTLPRDDGAPTELRNRKEKLAHYEVQCSHVGGRLYVGGEVVARSLDILRASSITHVINCVGFLYPPYFEHEFIYQTLYLQDTPGEDILCVLYDVFDFIESAPGDTGRVFLHCSQGVSRSTTLAIAYRMWRENRGYEEVFKEVKAMRGVANPNIGFICQLLQWHKRRTEEGSAPRLYRIAPQSNSAPLYLVPKLSSRPVLDPRGAFVLHVAPSTLFTWRGAQCPDDFIAAAERFAHQLHRYEGAPKLAIRVEQGSENPEFLEVLHGIEIGTSRASPAPPTAPKGREICIEASYDRDFELYAKASAPHGALDSPCDSARSGRKTPRAEPPPHAPSPNDRMRKQARSALLLSGGYRSARSSGGGSSYGLGTESARERALEFQTLAVRRQIASPDPPATIQVRYHCEKSPDRTVASVPSAEVKPMATVAVPKLPLLQLTLPKSTLEEGDEEDQPTSTSDEDSDSEEGSSGDDDTSLSSEEEEEYHNEKHPEAEKSPAKSSDAKGSGVPRLNLKLKRDE